MSKKLSILFGLLVLVSVSFSELVIVVHPNSPLAKISAKELKDIYRNKIKKWKFGGAIIRTSLKKGETHKAFCKTIKKSPSKLKRFWKKQVFTGKGAALKKFKSEKELINFIKDNELAIGYIDSASANDSIKVLPIK